MRRSFDRLKKIMYFNRPVLSMNMLTCKSDRKGVLDNESSRSANLGNDHGFIIKEYSLHWYEALLGKPKPKSCELYAQSGQYIPCGESCSSNMVLEHALNLVMPIDW